MGNVFSDLFRQYDKIIKNFCSNKNYVFLYGAGRYGRAVFSFLTYSGINFNGFCVTKDNDNKDISGKKVYEFDSIPYSKNECGFILSLKESYQDEVKEQIGDSERYLVLPEELLKKCSDVFGSMVFYNSAKISPTSIGGGYLMERTSGEHISRFVETLTEEENAKHFPDSRRYNGKENIVDRLICQYLKGEIISEKMILLRRFGGFGDVLCIEPVIRFLKHHGFEVFVETHCSEILKYNPDIRACFYSNMVPEVIKRNGIVIDFNSSYESVPFIHIVDSYIELGRRILKEMVIPENEKLPIYDSSLIRNHSVESVKKICLNNEASDWNSRTFSPQKMRAFGQYLVDCGYELFEIGKDEENYLGIGKNCYGMDLRGTVELMAEMDLYVGLDNCLMHLAQSIHLPIFVLFGCICPIYRIHDWSRARVMWKNVNDLSCAACYHRRGIPCSKVDCDRQKIECLDWAVDEVIYAFENMRYNNPPIIYEEMYEPLLFTRLKEGV